MTIGLWFWLLMLGWLIWGGIVGFRHRPAAAPFGPFYWGVGWSLLLFVLLLLIGCKIFGDPLSTLVK
jgi:hypothetical protein